jgi:hypothetical protein
MLMARPSLCSNRATARSAAVTAASMPGAWLALMTAELDVARSTTGLPDEGAGAIMEGWYILTRPWLFPHSSAAVMISACNEASSVSHPIRSRARAVVALASSMETMTTSALPPLCDEKGRPAGPD